MGQCQTDFRLKWVRRINQIDCNVDCFRGRDCPKLVYAQPMNSLKPRGWASCPPDYFRRAGLVAGPVLFLLILTWFDPVPESPQVGRMLAVVCLMAVWWITEAIPLAATSLLPVVLLPLLGIMPGKEVAPNYINSTIFIFIGGFLIALAMERWNLHRRIALRVLLLFGHSPANLVLGFMVAVAFLSAWISNTATTIAMMPVGLAVIHQLEDRYGREEVKRMATCLMLSIAYAASIGGIATPVGTPPNLVFKTIFEETFPGGPVISFGQWAFVGMPLSLVMLGLCWLLLTRFVFPPERGIQIDQRVIRDEYRSLGPISKEERNVLGVFAATALLWMGRESIQLGSVVIPGWTLLLPESVRHMVDDGTVAVGMALLLFLWPRKSEQGESERLLDVKVFQRIPWGIVLLFGGGFALAKGFVESGLSVWLAGSVFSGVGVIPMLAMVLLVCLVMTFLTEFTSNTASTQLVLPLLASAAVAQEIHPMVLMIPATFAASMAFMMPVATPPNAIIFGSERVSVAQMCRAGFWLNLISIVVVTLALYWIAAPVFGFSDGHLPDWAGNIAKP